MSTITFREVWKCFGETVAIKNLSFEVMDGEFFVLFGPAGAGKTTTLNLIAGLFKPTVGEITIGGRIVNDLPPVQRKVAMAFENYSLFPHMTVYENLANPLKAPSLKVAPSEMSARISQTAGMLGITDLLDRNPHQLSGGQKQRTALGRALVKDADVLLLDEPLAHVDAKIRNELRTEFHRLEALKQRTIIYVTHDYLEALSLGTRIGILDHGQFRQIAPPRVIYEKPCDTFVAQSVGWPQINLLECDVFQEDGVLYLVNPEARFRLRPTSEAAQLIETKSKDRVLVGIRGQHISPTPNDEEGVNIVLGQAEVFMPLGITGFLTVRVGRSIINVVTSPDAKYDHKQNVSLKIDDQQLIFFDAQSQRNLIYC